MIASKIIFKDREYEADEADEADDETAAVAVEDPQPLTDEEMAAELDQTAADQAQPDKQ